MKNLREFFGGGVEPPVSIVTEVAFQTHSSVTNTKKILSGALEAGILKPILSLSGAGIVDLLFVETIDATARTVRVRCTIDGVVVFDGTPPVIAGAPRALIILGLFSSYGGAYLINPQPRNFNSSFLVEISSSLNETDKLQLETNYTLS